MRVETVNGRAVWKLGDHFNADHIVGPTNIGQRNIGVLKAACLANVSASLQSEVRPGDIVIGGRNFGYGHPHGEGILALKALRLMLLAESLNPFWYRETVFQGFLAIACPGITSAVNVGDELVLHIREGSMLNISTGQSLRCDAIPPFLLDVVEAGGGIPYLTSADNCFVVASGGREPSSKQSIKKHQTST